MIISPIKHGVIDPFFNFLIAYSCTLGTPGSSQTGTVNNIIKVILIHFEGQSTARKFSEIRAINLLKQNCMTKDRTSRNVTVNSISIAQIKLLNTCHSKIIV